MQRFSFHTSDLLRFFGYTILFSILILLSERAFSPWVGNSTYNSASIRNQEIKESALILGQTTPKKPTNVTLSSEETVPVTSAPPASPEESAKETGIVISFRPDASTIDQSILEKIQSNTDSHYFHDKLGGLHIILDSDRIEPRGQVSGDDLILSTKITQESEQIKVFVHELGHVIDIKYLVGSSFRRDPSDAFYTISWESYDQKHKDAKLVDFVSGYALSNKYEDFAESFAFFVFHNEEFRNRAEKNAALASKYNFIMENLFPNNEFYNTSFSSDSVPSYFWDTTKIPINSKKYLFYIR